MGELDQTFDISEVSGTMARVTANVSMSLDGFIAGPNVSVDQPMGEGGLMLHDWLFSTSTNQADAEVERELRATTGAVVLGKRTFDVGLGSWGDTPLPVPCFVLTHHARGSLEMKGGTFTFVTEGIEEAVRQARTAAGDKDIGLMGAETAQRALRAGLVDQIQINLVPILLGDGTRLFDHLGTEHIHLQRTRVIESPRVTHLRFRVIQGAELQQ